MSAAPPTTECRECGAQFNLSAQYYYDNICPSCLKEKGEEERTWPSCTSCGEKKPWDDMKRVQVQNRAMRGGTEKVLKCSDCR